MQDSKLKALIESKIKALHELQHQAEAGCDTVTLDQTCVGRLSRMDAMQSQAMNQEAQRRRSAEISRLEAALKSMQEDGYGCCEECGEEIASGRLMLDPAAQFCILCAQKNESR
ncbi:MAG: TraR/DksA family transcriptional regulator [Proteobacteria bacterium]|nr:TraR/DksA family transcriptional regulator [Pseudomonadota bacterium]